MLPIKAYLVEAYHKCIVDSAYTPYMIVDATVDYVDVPKEHINDGQIILSLSPAAIRDLVFHRSYVSFRAQFSGLTHSVYVPIIAVLSIYAKEDPAEGITFDMADEDYDHPVMQAMPRSHFEDGDASSAGKKGAPFLRVVK